jgi:thiamine pyrophosphate-dependent acetolactate synthase large subunit-like protein
MSGSELSDRERPAGLSPGAPSWASDQLADLLRELGIEFVALNPGSSYRGLHDSLVNHLGNERPQMLLCLHEEHAVAIAHGYAKVTDAPLAVALHSNVGLMHASMAIFNAFCDRVPMLLLGASGPLDASRRRPWIDWLHTATDQAALVRPFLKWDDQPLSPPAAAAALLQASMLTRTVPRAPTYVCFDASVLEDPLDEAQPAIGVAGFDPVAAPEPGGETIAALAARLAAAERPVLLIGRTSRSTRGWEERMSLAETLGAQVFTHLKLPAAFPNRHPLHAAPASTFTSPELRAVLAAADVVLALDWLDLGGTLAAAGELRGETISVSLDHQLHSGWGKESFAPGAVDTRIGADVDATVTALLRELSHPRATSWAGHGRTADPRPAAADEGRRLDVGDIAAALERAVGTDPVSLVRIPNSWSGDLWNVEHPLDLLGADGGEGIGSGPGMVIGAALALRDSERLAIGVLGDGDFVMGANALWTAAHYGLGLLIVVADNRSFFNDEIHQHRVALTRDRPTENRWIGQRMADPAIDLAGLARAQGLLGHGPIESVADLERILPEALTAAQSGQAVVIDVLVGTSLEDEGSRAATQSERG